MTTLDMTTLDTYQNASKNSATKDSATWVQPLLETSNTETSNKTLWSRDRVITVLAVAAIALVITGVIMMAVGASKGVVGSHTTLDPSHVKGWTQSPIGSYTNSGGWVAYPRTPISDITFSTKFTTIGGLSPSGIVCVTGAAITTAGIGIGAFAIGRRSTQNGKLAKLNSNIEETPKLSNIKTLNRKRLIMITAAVVSALLLIVAVALIAKGSSPGTSSTQIVDIQNHYWYSGWGWAIPTEFYTYAVTTTNLLSSSALCAAGATLGALSIGIGGLAAGIYAGLRKNKAEHAMAAAKHSEIELCSLPCKFPVPL